VREATTRLSRLLAAPLCVAALVVGGGGVAADPPQRVVSLNLCLDQIALMVAAPGQLVATSDVSQDPHLSAAWRAARALPAVRMRVEEILALRPDLVLLDADAPAPVATLLRRAGVRVAAFAEAATFDEGVSRAREIAVAIGRAAAGDALADDMHRRAAALTAGDGVRPLAAIFQANGFTVGAGTVPDDLLRRAGFRNLAGARGAGAFAPLPLEALVLAAPDLLIVDGATSALPSLAEALVAHRAMRRAFAGARRLVMPHALWLCAGPQNLTALEHLAAARGALVPAR
jgi:iron complex transport system substrate-binding protein